MTFLGIDLGTSALKALLMADGGAILATAEVPLTVTRPAPGQAEQDPEDWWQAALAAAAAVQATAPAAYAAVRGIGLSGQMHAAVLLDSGNRVLRPAIIWSDQRAAAECARLNRGLPDLGHIAGVPAMASFPAPKLLWLEAHEPDTFRQIAMLLAAKDYLRLRMTGGCATDMCEAAGTLLLDERQRRWSAPLLAAVGLAGSQLPRLHEGPEITGSLTGGAAAALGLKPGTPVAAGAGDAAAGAIGLGAVNDGDAIISLGTAAQYFVTTAAYRPAPAQLIHAFAHGLPGRWFQMAALLNGASPLSWIAGVLGRSDIASLLQDTEQAFRGPSRLMFLPYLMGERTPHDDPQARGVLYGLTPDVGPEEIALGVIEGIALSLLDAQQALQAAGTEPAGISITGGGARSLFWMRLLASILGRTIHIRDGAATGPALGAARLARMAVTGEAVAAVCTRAAVKHTIDPEPALVAAYAGRIGRFQTLYQALKPVFRTDGIGA